MPFVVVSIILIIIISLRSLKLINYCSYRTVLTDVFIVMLNSCGHIKNTELVQMW